MSESERERTREFTIFGIRKVIACGEFRGWGRLMVRFDEFRFIDSVINENRWVILVGCKIGC